MPREAGLGPLPAVRPVLVVSQLSGGVSKGNNGFMSIFFLSLFIILREQVGRGRERETQAGSVRLGAQTPEP